MDLQQKQIEQLLQLLNISLNMHIAVFSALNALFEELYIDERQEITEKYEKIRQLMQYADRQLVEQFIKQNQHIKYGLALYEAITNMRRLFDAIGVNQQKPESGAKVVVMTPPKA